MSASYATPCRVLQTAIAVGYEVACLISSVHGDVNTAASLSLLLLTPPGCSGTAEEPKADVVPECWGRGCCRISKRLIIRGGGGVVAGKGRCPAIIVSGLQLIVTDEHQARVERFATVRTDSFLLLAFPTGHQLPYTPVSKVIIICNNEFLSECGEKTVSDEKVKEEGGLTV